MEPVNAFPLIGELWLSAAASHGKHQAHSKRRPNYGQMRGSSLCLRTKPEVTQLLFKGSMAGGGRGGRGGHRWVGGDQLLINIYSVSYWKENLQFVCHPLIQVVGPGGGATCLD